jgi:hypothetical protein
VPSHHHGPSVQQAREQLAARRRTAVRPSPRDRTVHAAATAVVGVDTGLLAATQNLPISRAVVSFGFILVWLAAASWAERVSRAVPRRARRRSRLGIVGSLVLALGAVLPWLNLQAQHSPNTWPIALVAAAVIAAPSLVAAVVILADRQYRPDRQ